MRIWQWFRFTAPAWLLALTLGACPPPASAASYPAMYVFGDSLSDAGNVWKVTLRKEPLSPPYFQGHFSNGPVWAQDFAAKLGLAALRPSLSGGTDYAYGGAESGPTSVHSASPLDLPAQLAEFEANVARPSGSALYVLWIGANDLFDMLSADLTPSQATHAIGDVVRNEEAFVTAIALGGAGHLMLVTAPDLGVTPTITSQGSAKAATATALSKQFNAQLTSRIRFLSGLYGIDLTIVDSLALIDSAVADPKHYGFTDVTHPCWTGGYTSQDGSLCALGEIAQNRHLFWDEVHPTARGHTFVAAEAAAALAGSTIAR